MCIAPESGRARRRGENRQPLPGCSAPSEGRAGASFLDAPRVRRPRLDAEPRPVSRRTARLLHGFLAVVALMLALALAEVGVRIISPQPTGLSYQDKYGL